MSRKIILIVSSDSNCVFLGGGQAISFHTLEILSDDVLSNFVK